VGLLYTQGVVLARHGGEGKPCEGTDINNAIALQGLKWCQRPAAAWK
jgi:hypothetical protein